jgi:two-component system, NarL family, nitrate/nitrite response regulator NarL
LSEKVRVVLVDDHPLLREGVAGTLMAEPDFEVVGHGENAEDAVRLARELMPEIMLVDVSMRGGGIYAAGAIMDVCPVVKIIMLTVSEREEDVLSAFREGVRGYVLKGVSGPELVRIVRSVMAGDPYVTPSLAAGLLGEWRERATESRAEADPLADLTRREREILELVAVGLSNKEIAGRLKLAEKTVKYYMTNVLQKLHVRNRVEAALLARQGSA